MLHAMFALINPDLGNHKAISPFEYAVLGAGIFGALLTATAVFIPTIKAIFTALVADLG